MFDNTVKAAVVAVNSILASPAPAAEKDVSNVPTRDNQLSSLTVPSSPSPRHFADMPRAESQMPETQKPKVPNRKDYDELREVARESLRQEFSPTQEQQALVAEIQKSLYELRHALPEVSTENAAFSVINRSFSIITSAILENRPPPKTIFEMRGTDSLEGFTLLLCQHYGTELRLTGPNRQIDELSVFLRDANGRLFPVLRTSDSHTYGGEQVDIASALPLIAQTLSSGIEEIQNSPEAAAAKRILEERAAAPSGRGGFMPRDP